MSKAGESPNIRLPETQSTVNADRPNGRQNRRPVPVFCEAPQEVQTPGPQLAATYFASAANDVNRSDIGRMPLDSKPLNRNTAHASRPYAIDLRTAEASLTGSLVTSVPVEQTLKVAD
jgi:hypothetical protein